MSKTILLVSMILLGIISGCGTGQSMKTDSLLSYDQNGFVVRQPFVSTDPIAQSYSSEAMGLSFQYPKEFVLDTSDKSIFLKQDKECMGLVTHIEGVFDKKTYQEYGYSGETQQKKIFQVIDTAYAIRPVILPRESERNVSIGNHTWFTFTVDLTGLKPMNKPTGCKIARLQQTYILSLKNSYFKFAFYSVDEKTIEKILATVKVGG